MGYKTKINLDHLGFVRVEPSLSLKTYIDSYWFIDASCRDPQGYKQFLHADGGMGFIFNYGDALSYDGEVENSNASLDGISTKSTRLVLTENIKAVGIRFKPAGASIFFKAPLHELKDQRINLCDLNSIHFANLYEQISEQTNLLAKVAIIEKVLHKTRRQDGAISTRITNAIQHLKDSQGCLPLNYLSKNLNINQRKLERLFKAQLGMTASEYTKTIRAERARTILKTTNLSLTNTAYKLGFYDQAHFIKNFKSVVGLTPGQYRSYSRGKSLRPD